MGDGPGRPRLWTDAEAFAAATDEYFDTVKAEETMPTMAGLCLHLGFEDRESLGRYLEYGPAFSRTVKRAKMRMENDRNQRLANAACTGAIFDLKVNHGWQDKQVVEHAGEIEVTDARDRLARLVAGHAPARET